MISESLGCRVCTTEISLCERSLLKTRIEALSLGVSKSFCDLSFTVWISVLPDVRIYPYKYGFSCSYGFSVRITPKYWFLYGFLAIFSFFARISYGFLSIFNSSFPIKLFIPRIKVISEVSNAGSPVCDNNV